MIPELGQLLRGGPIGRYELPELARTGVLYLFAEIRRVLGNDLDRCAAGIPGIECLPYNDEDPRPNLKVQGFDVEVRWYKHVGRSMNATRRMTDDEWSKWMETALRLVREYETNGVP